jgi:DNA (cytosine-5)-methyltransferase 1
MKSIKVVELFAGVGGFRVGLEKASSFKNSFEVVWSNQWEPGETKQYASQVYMNKWPDSFHSNVDISTVEKLPIKPDLIVGGFPCQDYSVAKSLSQSQGISGKKGVLWWEIHRLIKSSKVPSILLENVDRLLGSPAKQRGRDFALMLASLNDLGYIVEWRVINAADYGYSQKRKRVFIFAYKKKSLLKKEIFQSPLDWIYKKSIFAQAFPAVPANKSTLNNDSSFEIEGDLVEITDNFNLMNKNKDIFLNAGVAVDRKIKTVKLTPSYQGPYLVLKDVLLKAEKISSEFYIDEADLIKWAKLKGAKQIPRTSKSGLNYLYSEGKMTFPDSLTKPSRTIVTGEGGKSPSRFKHVIKVKSRYRRLVPDELEQLNGFEPGHTYLPGISDTKRAFFMGNALVTSLVRDFGVVLLKNKDLYY